MPPEDRPFRGLGLGVVVAALVGLAFVLAFFVLCDSGRTVCFDTATHLSSDYAVLGFLLLFLVGIGLMTFPSEEPEETGSRGYAPRPPPPPQPLAAPPPGAHRPPHDRSAARP